jgi:O-antigen/teichoic acid export membrane protein
MIGSTSASTSAAGGAATGPAGVAGAWRRLPIWPPRLAVEALLRRKLARDVAFLQVSNALQKGYGAAFNVFCYRALGATAYGEFLLVLALYTTINILGSLGLGQFLVVPLAQAAAAGDREEVARSMGYNLKLSGISAAAVLVLALAVGPWIGATMMQRPDLGALMRIAALGALPAVAYTVCTTALQSVRRMRELAVVENVNGLLTRGVGVLAVLAGGQMPGLVWGVAIGGTISAAYALYEYRRVAVRHHGFPGFAALLAAAWRVPFRRYFRFSALAVLDKNVAQLFAQTPLIFLGRWAGPEQAAYFGVASKLFALLASFHGAVSKALSVRLSQEYRTAGAAPTRRLFWQTALLWGGISSLGALGFVLLLPVFKWVYTAEAFPSLLLVLLFAALTAKQGFTVALGSVFLVLDRVAVNVLAKLPILLLALPAGVVLVQRWGAVGAAGYQLGAYLLGDLVYFGILSTPWFWRRPRGRASQTATSASLASVPGGQSA